MGAFRDEQLFAEMDASASGFSEGRRTGERVVSAVLSDALGVSRDTLGNLQGLGLEAKIFALEDVVRAAGVKVLEARKEYARYSSEDPEEVAVIIIEKQLNQDEERSYTRGTDYMFDKTEDGYEVKGYLYMHSWLDRHPLDGEWVGKHLGNLGFNGDEEFCNNVASSIITQLECVEGSTNG